MNFATAQTLPDAHVHSLHILSGTMGTSTAPQPQQPTSVSPQSKISAAVDAWLDSTYLMSSLDDIRRDPYHQLLRRVGWPAVPPLLARIREGQARIQCAELLTEITGDDPVVPADFGRADRVGDAWLAWGRLRGFL